jgi:hypothetical protein
MDCFFLECYMLRAASDELESLDLVRDTTRLGPFLLIALLLLLAWSGGFLMFHVASGLIHLLLVLAVLSFLFHFLTGRRTA